MDSPWHRLPWTLPTALLIWAAALWGLAYFMEKPAHRPMEPPPIDAQLIEQPVPTAISSIQPERTVAVHKRKSLPMVKSQQPPVTPQVSPRIEQNPTAQKPEVTANPSRNEVQSNSLGDTSANNAATNETQSKTAENTSAKNAIQTGSYDGNGKSRVICMRTVAPGQLTDLCRKFRTNCGMERSIPLHGRVLILRPMAA